MKSIDIIIDANGNATVEAQGFAGKGCKDATKFLEQALGVITDTKNKPEFFAAERVINRGHIGK